MKDRIARRRDRIRRLIGKLDGAITAVIDEDNEKNPTDTSDPGDWVTAIMYLASLATIMSYGDYVHFHKIGKAVYDSAEKAIKGDPEKAPPESGTPDTQWN